MKAEETNLMIDEKIIADQTETEVLAKIESKITIEKTETETGVMTVISLVTITKGTETALETEKVQETNTVISKDPTPETIESIKAVKDIVAIVIIVITVIIVTPLHVHPPETEIITKVTIVTKVGPEVSAETAEGQTIMTVETVLDQYLDKITSTVGPTPETQETEDGALQDAPMTGKVAETTSKVGICHILETVKLVYRAGNFFLK